MRNYTKECQVLFSHVGQVLEGVSDIRLKEKYLGFLSVNAVSVFEINARRIFVNFASSENAAFGNFVSAHFSRLNGRIKYQDICAKHLKLFGSEVSKSFKENANIEEKKSLANGRGSIFSSYDNIITWRHSYVHTGDFPDTTNYGEMKRSFDLGCRLIDCLNSTLNGK